MAAAATMSQTQLTDGAATATVDADDDDLLHGWSDALKACMQRLRLHCHQHRVRVAQYFQDFDRGRKGWISRGQFDRALDMSGLTHVVRSDEWPEIYAVFAHQPDGVNYAAFCECVDAVFTRRQLERNPTAKAPVVAPQQGPLPLSPEDENAYARLMAQVAADTLACGVILKAPFVDFDRHRCGKVTTPQFHRAFPFKADTADVDVVVRRWADPRSGNVNYQGWIRDVERMLKAEAQRTKGPTRAEAQLGASATAAGAAATGATSGGEGRDVDALVDALRSEVRQSRARVADSMADYDKLHSGLITVDQFKSCLGRLKLQRCVMDDRALNLISARYTVSDPQALPKVAYGHFVNDIEENHTVKAMEKDPNCTFKYTAEQFKNTPVAKTLGNEDEIRVASVMDRIRNVVSCRRLLLKPAFQDFDRAAKGVYQTRTTSKKRFERVLALNGINLKEEEFELVERKYEAAHDATSVNYVLFCSHVEEQEQRKVETANVSAAPAMAKFVRPGRRDEAPTLEGVVDDIRTQVLTQRIRVNEFLRDYDKLRSGAIMNEQLASGLFLAKIEVDEAELRLVTDHYAVPNRRGYVRWTQFCDDIDAVTTTKRLESNPLAASAGCGSAIHARLREEREPRRDPEVLKVIAKLREIVRTRGIILPPFLNDFDTHNVGQITPTRLGQALTRHEMGLSQAEIHLIAEAYMDPRTRHVCYRRLIADIDDTECPKPPAGSPTQAVLSLSGSALSNGRTAASTAAAHGALFGSGGDGAQTVEEVLEKVKAKVAKDSVRVRDFFVDADKLRKGHVPASKFRTGVDGAGLKLSGRELCLLEEAFASAHQEGYVAYERFCLAVSPDSAKIGLEKNPGRAAEPYKPGASHPLKMLKHQLDDATSAMVDGILERLSVLARTRRVLLKPTFLDFDKIRQGQVSRNQFAAALDKLQLKVRPEECDRLVMRFEV